MTVLAQSRFCKAPPPSRIVFAEGLTVDAEGWISAVRGDEFVIGQDFFNHSQRDLLWKTDQSRLIFSGDGPHVLTLPSEDRGLTPFGFWNNFAWGELIVEPGVDLVLTDGDTTNQGTALYVGVLQIEDRDQIDFANRRLLSVVGDANVYYDPRREENAYLDGQTYTFADGSGMLQAQVPNRPSG